MGMSVFIVPLWLDVPSIGATLRRQRRRIRMIRRMPHLN
jgi:hypothetical protein